jgi:hypothetical protein
MFKRKSPELPARPGKICPTSTAFEPLEARALMSAVEWIGGPQGNWDEPANWSGGAVPGINDDVRIAGEQPPTVALDAGSHAIRSLLVEGATLDVTGGELAIANGGSVTYPGVLNLRGGRLTTETQAGARMWLRHLTTFNMSGGVLIGDLHLEYNNSFFWTGGEMASPGTTVVGGGANTYNYIRGTTATPVLSRPLNYGGRTLSLSGNLLFRDGSFDYAPTSHFVEMSGASLLDGGGTNVIRGLVRVTGDTRLEVPAEVTGIIGYPNESGVLHLRGGGTGEFAVTGASELHIEGSGYSLDMPDFGYQSNGAVFFEGGSSTVGSVSSLGGAYVSGTGTTVTFTGEADIGALFIGQGTRVRMAGTGDNVLRTGSLSLAGNATFDIGAGSILVDYNGASPLQNVRTMLRSGYAQGAWNGPGIGSSAVGDTSHGVGYAEASDLFSEFPAYIDGHEVDDTTVVIRFTRSGDANLDRTVNLLDFNRLAGSFGVGRHWSAGDFNYDLTVNLQDFNRLAANFGQSAQPDFGESESALLQSSRRRISTIIDQLKASQ